MDTTGAMGAPRTAQFTVASHPRNVSNIRQRVGKFARSVAFTADQLDDIGIAVGEASTNAVKHGRNGSGRSRIRVKLESSGDVLRVFISDDGPGFDPENICPPGVDDLRECGRGIFCMRSLMDEVHFHPLKPGMCVELVKRITA